MGPAPWPTGPPAFWQGNVGAYGPVQPRGHKTGPLERGNSAAGPGSSPHPLDIQGGTPAPLTPEDEGQDLSSLPPHFQRTFVRHPKIFGDQHPLGPPRPQAGLSPQSHSSAAQWRLSPSRFPPAARSQAKRRISSTET
jgi:hypothetical protein